MTDTKGKVAFGPRSPRFPSSKLCAPTTALHLVHRSRLLASWTEGNGRASAWWWAPPGAGKTALLVADTSPKAGTAITAYASALIILLVIGLF
jgi:ATP/maltotriose-dependent transcriptional regulator MalT